MSKKDIKKKPNKDLLKALKEGEKIGKGEIKVKGYHDVNKMIKEI